MRADRRFVVIALAGLLGAGAGGAACAFDPNAVLAPTGALRVGVYPGSPTSLKRDPAGKALGVTVELGTDLARRIGVPVAVVEFSRVAQVIDAIAKAEVDFTVTNATPARAAQILFTEPLLTLELGFLVPPGSSVTDPDQLDVPQRRVGVTQGGTSERTLAQRLTRPTVVPVPSLKRAVEMLRAGELEAYATNKSVLFQMADELPGSRVLDGRWGVERLAIGLPKGRDSALPFLRSFVDESRSSGLLAGAAARAGLRGVASGE